MQRYAGFGDGQLLQMEQRLLAKDAVSHACSGACSSMLDVSVFTVAEDGDLLQLF